MEGSRRGTAAPPEAPEPEGRRRSTEVKSEGEAQERASASVGLCERAVLCEC